MIAILLALICAPLLIPGVVASASSSSSSSGTYGYGYVAGGY